MLHILGGYIIYDLRSPGIMEQLWARKRITLVLQPHPEMPRALALVDQALKSGKAKVFSSAEIRQVLKQKVPDAQFIELEPKEPKPIGLNIEVWKELLSMVPRVDGKQNWPMPGENDEAGRHSH